MEEWSLRAVMSFVCCCFFLGAWYRIRVEKFAGCGNVAGVPIIGAYGDGGDCLVRV